METSIEVARQQYAEKLRTLAHVSSPALLAAFATVPRERFVGPGPWRVLSEGEFWLTEDDDPRHLYHNVLISLDAAKGINNGQPSLWAHCFDQLGVRAGDRVLHLGCGTGYYTAILAELTGPQGRVVAIDIDTGMARTARAALAPWPQVEVLHQDGSRGPFAPADIIVVSAGATYPLPCWLAALKPQGKLLFPMTSSGGGGAMVLLTRVSEDRLEARLTYGAYFIAFSGARDPEVSRSLSKALMRDHGVSVHSLRCDRHAKDSTCWLHGDGWCFSTQEAVVPAPLALEIC